MKQQRLLILPLIIVSSLLLGCDVIGDAALDCIDGDGPEFSRTNIPPATLGHYYEAQFNAAINNEPNDDSYSYRFTIDGALPEGVYRSYGDNERQLKLSGTPTQIGIYTFTVGISVAAPESYWDDDDDYYDDGDDLCTTYHSERFSIRVSEPEDDERVDL